MHRARAFFFVCAGLLCLAVAYHLGALDADAQVRSTVAGMTWDNYSWPGVLVMTPNGECYWRAIGRNGPGAGFDGGVTHIGNFWGGKVKYATPAPRKATKSTR